MKVGDVVELLSGSPEMTVVAVIKDDCLCNWFVENTFCQNKFPAISLKLIRRNKQDNQ